VNPRHLLLLLLVGATALQVVAEDKPIDGSIVFRGKIDGTHFRGSGFDIEVGEAKVSIRNEKNEAEFTIPLRDQKLADAVLSHNREAAAVVLKGTPWPSRRQALATSNSNGIQRMFNYKTYEMTKELGWIVELGAVSDDGSLVLAKCAFMMPAEGDVQRVNHKWLVVRVGAESLEVVEAESAIDRWSEIVGSQNPPE
jgi:hypothetical protein